MQGSIKKIIEKNGVKYRQLTYIESTGTQYFYSNVETALDVKMQLDIDIQEVGGQNGSAAFLIGLNQIDDNIGRYIARLGNNGSVLSIEAPLGRHTLILDGVNKTFTVDNNTLQMSVGGTPTTTNIAILARRDGTTDSYFVKGKLYGAKLWKNNVLKKDFIPVERDTDKVVGMLDLVSGTLSVNIGSGTFVKGDYVKIEHIYKNPSKFNVKTYEVLDYIESSGTQYIDTGIAGNTISKIDLKTFITVDPAALKTFGVIDEITSSSFKRLHIGVSGNNVYAFGFKKDAIPTTRGQVNPPNPIIVDITNNKYTVNGEEYSFSTTGEYPTSTFRLFGRNSNTSTRQDAISMKLYYAKFYVGGELKKDFIPVKRLRDNAYGLLDKLTNTFYANEGSGVFIGQSFEIPEYIEEEVYRVDYIENTGKSHIDLGIGCDLIKNIEFEFMGVSWGSDQILLGAFTQAIKGCNYPQVQPSRLNIYGNGASKTILSRAPSTTKKCKLIVPITSTGTAYYYEDRELLKSIQITNKNIETLPMMLFTLNLNGSASQTHYSKMKVYSFKGFGLDDKLLFDLIPVKYGEEFCMLDLVENKLYHNNGTGAFAGGNRTEVKEITNIIIHNDTKYAILDYIKSDELCAINTGVKCDENLIVEMDIELPTTTYPEQKVFGAIEKVGTSGFRRFHMGVSTTKWFCGIKGTTKLSSFDITSGKHKVIMNSKEVKYYIDGVATTITNTGGYPTSTDFYIFERNTNDEAYRTNMEFYLYSMKMTNESGLVRDFIPVERMSDGTKGLFDKVNNVFYTNLGIGTFSGNKRKIIMVE